MAWVTFASSTSIARHAGDSRSSTLSASASSITASPKIFDATAPWDLVQNSHSFFFDTYAANSSRSATDHADGPRMTSWIRSLNGRPNCAAR